ncbi:MAG: sigma-70 family RNA polymerase sigma factor, partial [Clostridia bacterium]|nr:sigma-70 family RNA polymerase sigma factor [Clostridia bacterium]
ADDVAEFLEEQRPKEASATRKKYRHKAHYSLDAGDGIENETLQRILAETQQDEQLRMQLETAMASLSAIQRRRVYKNFYLGQSYTDIARDENIAVNSVKESILSGIEKLKKYFC